MAFVCPRNHRYGKSRHPTSLSKNAQENKHCSGTDRARDRKCVYFQWGNIQVSSNIFLLVLLKYWTEDENKPLDLSFHSLKLGVCFSDYTWELIMCHQWAKHLVSVELWELLENFFHNKTTCNYKQNSSLSQTGEDFACFLMKVALQTW